MTLMSLGDLIARVAYFEQLVNVDLGHCSAQLKAVLIAENFDLLPPTEPTYVNITAPPSTLPNPKYCDVTGLPANYTDPRTKLNYFSSDVFQLCRTMTEVDVNKLLKIRNSGNQIAE